MAEGRITPLQSEFLKQLFGASCGNLKLAAEAIGVEDYSMLMTDELTEAIKRRADQEIAMNIPKAIFTMQNMLDNPNNTFNMDKLTKLCTEFLDRAGLGKVERSGGGGLKIGLVILPDKLRIEEPVTKTIEHEVSLMAPVEAITAQKDTLMGVVVELEAFLPKKHHRDSDKNRARQADQVLLSTIRVFCIAAERMLKDEPMPKDVRRKAMRMQAIAQDQPLQ